MDQLRINKEIGERIEKEVAQSFACYSFPCYRNGYYDFNTPDFIIEVKSCHKSNKSHKGTRKGRFYIPKFAHKTINDYAIKENKKAFYVFVLLNEKHEITDECYVSWKDVNSLLSKVKLLKREDYEIPYNIIFNLL